MTRRWVDSGLALLAAAIMAAMVLFPAGPSPEDVELEIVSVRALPSETNFPQRVEVQARWRWLVKPRDREGWNLVAIGVDRGRWIVAEPSSGYGVNGRMLSLLEEPYAYSGSRVNPGERGERTFVLVARDAGRYYEAPTFTVHLEYIHQAPDRFGWPGRSWVRTVSGTYPLEAGAGQP